MRDALPPAELLRAFSRVAETSSVKAAAADLALSPSAVSRQLRALEAHLGVALFRRLNPGLEITEAGRCYLETVNRVLADLRRAQETLAVPRSGPLRVSALASPRLAGPPVREPGDLRAHTLIHLKQTPEAWSDWLGAAGVPALRARRSVTYDHVSIVLSAAEAGHGVALSSELLCAARLAAGRLRAPFDLRVRSAATYHLVCRPEGLDDPRIVAFRDWLVDALG